MAAEVVADLAQRVPVAAVGGRDRQPLTCERPPGRRGPGQPLLARDLSDRLVVPEVVAQDLLAPSRSPRTRSASASSSPPSTNCSYARRAARSVGANEPSKRSSASGTGDRA